MVQNGEARVSDIHSTTGEGGDTPIVAQLRCAYKLISEVPNISSGNIWAARGAGKWGSQRSPVEEKLMVSPFGNKTRMRLLWHTLLRCSASVSRSRMCDDPVSTQGSCDSGRADEDKAFGRKGTGPKFGACSVMWLTMLENVCCAIEWMGGEVGRDGRCE